MDENLLHELLKSHSKVVTIEDNVVSGGFGSRINKFVIDNNQLIHPRTVKARNYIMSKNM